MVYDYATIASELYRFSELFSLPSMFVYSIVGIIMAFFGYKIFKTFLRATYAIAGGIIAAEMVTLYIPVENWLPDVFGLSWTAVIAVVVGILAAILAPFIYKFVGGFLVGDMLGVLLMAVLDVKNEIAVLAVSLVLGIVFGLLFTKIFKAVYILSTSFSGTVLTGFSLGVILFPETFNYLFAETMKTYYSQLGAASADIQMALEDVGLANLSVPASDMGALLFGALIIVGIVAGIVATIVQFKKCKEI